MIESLRELGKFAMENDMRIDFHPDHFVLLNSPKPEIFKQSLLVLKLHHQLLRAWESISSIAV